MILLVSGATRTVARHPAVGRFVGPRNGNRIEEIATSGRVWAADNDAFCAWDQERFWTMLGKIARVDRSRFLWVACPDVVADAKATLESWDAWIPQLEYLGLPAAFVGQDGCEQGPIPWESMACFFLGGSDSWKLSVEAEALVKEAKSRGKWIHMGRVNSMKRRRHAFELGCDSIDGRSYSAWPDRRIPEALQQIDYLTPQLLMF